MTENLLRREEITAGLCLEFIDCSNRYFGDYHRLLIEVDALIVCDDGPLRLRYQKPLRKMGVSGDAADSEKMALIEGFLATASTYMRRDEYVGKLLESLQRPGQKVWRRIC